ncbi:snake venom 5'-nucleotidase-like [Amphibalanus amphitrite]|uniref:snake venom 5'-nucleotidase-like n=1 Tax=Amphibalanus amphitrite TaxID=1232801 RepID=UPI001C9040E7|nr:snake venom 5'-nucleotidase-like [Amphibalanus amphitrite]
MPRLVQVVREERARADAVLVVDAGGQFNTALLDNPSAPELLTDLVSLVGYDVMALGRPELLGGLEALRRYIALVGVPFVCTGGLVPQVNASAGAPPCNASMMLTVGRVKVGIVSYLAPNTVELIVDEPPAGIQSKPLSQVQEEAKRLRSQGARLIIGLIYCSWMVSSDNMSIIANELTDIDLVVTGNAGHLFYNGPSPHGEVAHGPHPATLERPGGGKPLLAVASHNMLHYAGYLRIKVAPGGGISEWDGDNPRLLTGDKDAAAEAVMARLRPNQSELLGGLVARSLYMLEGGGHCRDSECALGTLIADAMLEASIQPEYKGNDILAWTRAGTVIFQGWVVQSSISAGLVYEEDLRVALPLDDRLVIVSVLGRRLVSLLEAAVRSGVYSGLQVSGVRLDIAPDPDDGKAMTVHLMKVLCTVCQMPAFKAVNHRYTYRLVSSETCVKLVFSQFKSGLQYEPLNITLRDAARKLMRKLSPMAVPREERIILTTLHHHDQTGAAPDALRAASVLLVGAVVAVFM